MPRDRSDGRRPPERDGQAEPQDRVRRGLLLDFYGELLSPRQRECCELCFNDDLSLSEIAETCGISRQGAWDNIRRGTEALESIEARTGLLRRHSETVSRLKKLEEMLRRLEKRCSGNADLAEPARTAREEVSAMLRTED